MVKSKDPAVRAALMAASAAKVLGLKVGNMWEPPIARQIEEDIREHGEEWAQRNLNIRLGLDRGPLDPQ